MKRKSKKNENIQKKIKKNGRWKMKWILLKLIIMKKYMGFN